MRKEQLKKIKDELEKIIQTTNKSQAAFDADGTLWPCDIGKNFFQYQISNKLLKDKCEDPRAEFDKLRKEKGQKAALLWLAQVQSGTPLKTMNKWVQDFLKENTSPIFEFQQEIIYWLLKKKVQVFIVSSSLQWVLDQALPLKGYPITKENIIGVETKIKNGVITDELNLPAPVGPDKVGAFQKRTKNTSPIFASGNTLADQDLLESATHLRLVISTATRRERNYESEQKLLELAKNKKWFSYETNVD